MRRLILLVVALWGVVSIMLGQQIFVSERVENMDFPYKKEVIDFWCNYVEASRCGNPVRQYWLGESQDVIADFCESIYQDYSLRLNDVQIVEGKYRMIVEAKHLTEQRVGAIQVVDYQFYVVLTDMGLRLVNYFDVVKSTYQHRSTEHIDFYAIGRPITEEQIQLSEQFLEAFESVYGATMQKRLTMIYSAGSSNRALGDLGIIKIYNGHNDFRAASYLTRLHTIVSPTLPEFHELVHAIMIPNYPEAPLLLHEGIAVFAGESKRLKEQRRKDAIRYLMRHKVDFSSPNQLHALLKDNAMVFYAVAGAIIKHCFETKGGEAVIRLFEATDYDGVFEKLNVPLAERTAYVFGLFGLREVN